MTTSNGFAQQAPLYVRALRLRHLHVGGFVSFLLFECMIAVGVLLALAELVSWWAVPVLPTVVAIMVKVNDMVIGGSRRARAMARAAERGSSERASSGRVDLDDRTDDTPSVARRTATSLDRAEIARAGRAARSAAAAGARTGSVTGAGADAGPAVGAGTGSESGSAPATGAGSGTGTGTGATRTRTIEPPAQRKKVGVIKISLPPKDGGVGGGSRHSADERPREVVDAGYGISPGTGSDGVTGDPAPLPAAADADSGAYAASGAHAAADDTAGAHGAGAHGAGSTYVSGAYAEAHVVTGDEWTDTDSHGFQRSRPLHPSGWSERAAQDPWATTTAAVEPAHAVGNDAQEDWSTDTGAGWGDRAAWSSSVSGNGQANWGDETVWGDRAAWGEQEPVVQHGRGGQHASAAGGSADSYGYGQYAPAQQNAQDWDDETGFADQAAWRARSPYGSRSTWGTYGEWEPGAPDYVSDYTGSDSAAGSTTGSATGSGSGSAYNSATGSAAGSTYSSGTGSAYGSGAGSVGGSAYGSGGGSAYGEASREEAARDLAARGEAYRTGDVRNDDPYGWRGDSRTTGEHRRGDEDHPHGDVARHDDGSDGRDGRALNRESGGRHARQQPPPPGRRRSEDADNFTSGYFTTGRHAERGWRSDDELARQRAGGVNQGRFA
ncbi:hypothetical protein [Dactylosporangium matsuzakiense]|uniref:Uncharacterized protein n=1 Tax=Dactylosporangium matsuzakiense TaxID=53360 RepID=A0A9W6KMW9_9ACTN|nr:hypothetical protein [Dactylosporangium matsuzakiense]UWZ43953.1 hypothetical protein Dmats_42150 [Dactylosporangium matsuzakiense]GLL03201.1 hypothetical protein GCM10017581_049450 [Dactylosporangium matsuzakiense]